MHRLRSLLPGLGKYSKELGCSEAATTGRNALKMKNGYWCLCFSTQRLPCLSTMNLIRVSYILKRSLRISTNLTTCTRLGTQLNAIRILLAVQSDNQEKKVETLLNNSITNYYFLIENVRAIDVPNVKTCSNSIRCLPIAESRVGLRPLHVFKKR